VGQSIDTHLVNEKLKNGDFLGIFNEITLKIKKRAWLNQNAFSIPGG